MIECTYLYYHWSSRNPGKRIKEQVFFSAVPQSKAQLQDYHSLHLVFTIMLYKSLVSYIVAFTMASSVAVSANPVGGGGGPAVGGGSRVVGGGSPVVGGGSKVGGGGGGSSKCNTGSVQCCDQITNGGDSAVVALASTLGITVSPTAVVGLTCTSVTSADQW
jgi:hypothetical protein